MIINFKVENWLSIKEEIELNLTSGPERKFSQHVPIVKKVNKKILPICCLFGANASGKTNLFRALDFFKKLVTEPLSPDASLNRIPFSLDKEYPAKPTRLSLKFLAGNDNVYTLSVALNSQEILTEELSINNSRGERQLYYREGKNIKIANSKNMAKLRLAALMFAAKGTKPNQLFISNVYSQNIDEYNEPYCWFDRSLTLITPDTKYNPFYLSNDSLEDIKALLKEFDTGIDDIRGIDFSLENLPLEIKNDLLRMPADTCYGFPLKNGDFILMAIENNEPKATKLVTLHKDKNGELRPFNFSNESDGTQRLIELGPVLSTLASSSVPMTNKVYVIDEMDRSLHTMLTAYIVKKFIKKSSHETRAQLLFTCHDAMLIDQSLFRKDEIFVSYKNKEKATKLYELRNSKKARSDSDLRKLYLEGVFGGVPKIPNVDLEK